MTRIGWTQPLCASCFDAWTLGRGDPPRTPVQVVGADDEPCLVCGRPTCIYVRIDPVLSRLQRHPKERAS